MCYLPRLPTRIGGCKRNPATTLTYRESVQRIIHPMNVMTRSIESVKSDRSAVASGLPTQLKLAAEPPTILEFQFLPHPKFDLTDSG
jgi:hypothetical protein